MATSPSAGKSRPVPASTSCCPCWYAPIEWKHPRCVGPGCLCHHDDILNNYDLRRSRVFMVNHPHPKENYMQLKRLALAVIAAAPLCAFAQTNVTIYGVVDAGLSKEDTGAPNGKRTLQLNSGNQSSSRFGFRGSEDLGGGMKAIFNLEGGYEVSTLTIGREYSPIAAIAGATDALGQGFYGSNLSAFNNTFGGAHLTRRLSNSVNYKSNTYSGFSLLAAYSAGEQASPTPNTTPAPDSLNLRGVALQYR